MVQWNPLFFCFFLWPVKITTSHYSTILLCSLSNGDGEITCSGIYVNFSIGYMSVKYWAARIDKPLLWSRETELYTANDLSSSCKIAIIYASTWLIYFVMLLCDNINFFKVLIKIKLNWNELCCSTYLIHSIDSEFCTILQ